MHPLRHGKRRYLAGASALFLGIGAPPAHAQELAPLADPDADLIAPLVDPDADLIAPLVDPDADLIAPLVPPKMPKPRKPGRMTHVDEIVLEERPDGMVLIQRIRADPCGIFEVSWGGRKTCRNREIKSYELVPADSLGKNRGPIDNDKDEDDQSDDTLKGRPPSGSGGRPPSGSGSGPGPGGKPPGNGGGPGPATGPSGAPGGAAGGAKSGTGGGSAPGTGASTPGNGGIAAPTPAPEGYRRTRDFDVRIVRATVDASGQVDVLLNLRNATRAAKLVANGDWTVTVTDEDGLGVPTRALWMPGTGTPQPFHIMPNVAPGATREIRFLLKPETVHARLVTLSVQQNGAPPISFGLPALATRPNVTEGAPAGNGPFSPLRNLEVRLDRAAPYPGRRFELVFTARNRSTSVQYLGGSNLNFSAIGSGDQQVTIQRETFSIRGTPVTPTGSAPIQPGAIARLRVLFDQPVAGPFKVSDGSVTATLQPTPASEPEW
ncbi:hypothetical protein [Sphingomonas sp. NIBR02145]|uniref:hypothetical protein n=1 Tax=Sphingomonas sp. NIBR02145 TaxID=3014784 RepID=UPI0022B568BD|nr:hypothetical protein [Sphingomonas sp. NIBR02145]WHU04333.1 hypothetical protein O3305_07015 [Sphingomonas sp. NIBR02145]